jgi:hypothetical protein
VSVRVASESTETESSDRQLRLVKGADAADDGLVDQRLVDFFRVLLECDARRTIMTPVQGDQIDEFDLAA